MSLFQNQAVRVLVFLLGVTSLLLGLIGAFVPLLPTTPFLLLSAWCFLKSSKTAHSWLHRQPFISKTLKNWNEHRAISRQSKVLALLFISGSLVLIFLKVNHPVLKLSVSALLLGVCVFIISRTEV